MDELIQVPDDIRAIVKKTHLTKAEAGRLEQWFRDGGWQCLADEVLRIDESLPCGDARFTHNAMFVYPRIAPPEIIEVEP